jgi:hypothetical protein
MQKKEKTFSNWHGKVEGVQTLLLDRKGDKDIVMQNLPFVTKILLSPDTQVHIEKQMALEKLRIQSKEKWQDWAVLGVVFEGNIIHSQVGLIKDLRKSKWPISFNSTLKKSLSERRKEENRNRVVAVLVNGYLIQENENNRSKIDQSEYVVVFPFCQKSRTVIRQEMDKLTRKCCTYCQKLYYGMKKCSQCSNVYYCNRECQVSHWPLHKPDCNRNV